MRLCKAYKINIESVIFFLSTGGLKDYYLKDGNKIK